MAAKFGQVERDGIGASFFFDGVDAGSTVLVDLADDVGEFAVSPRLSSLFIAVEETEGLKFVQVVLVELFCFGDCGSVPRGPLTGLVSADEEDGLSTWVEDEQDPTVFGGASGPEFFEVVVVRSFDPVGVRPVELGSVLC